MNDRDTTLSAVHKELASSRAVLADVEAVRDELVRRRHVLESALSRLDESRKQANGRA